MNRVWITGYRNYELGVFNQNDKKSQVIKKTLKNEIMNLIENGCDWIITGGQLGTEQWVIEIANELKLAGFNQFQLAIMTPFKNFGEKWNESNQIKLQQLIATADFFASTSQNSYTSPQQLKNYQKFMLTHTDQAIFLYDSEHEGKTLFDYQAALNYQENHTYPIQLIELDDLQSTAEAMSEESSND